MEHMAVLERTHSSLTEFLGEVGPFLGACRVCGPPKFVLLPPVCVDNIVVIQIKCLRLERILSSPHS